MSTIITGISCFIEMICKAAVYKVSYDCKGCIKKFLQKEAIGWK